MLEAILQKRQLISEENLENRKASEVFCTVLENSVSLEANKSWTFLTPGTLILEKDVDK